jgi:adenylate cyclase
MSASPFFNGIKNRFVQLSLLFLMSETSEQQSTGSVYKPTILIVDDTPANVTLLIEALKPEFRTKIATNGERTLSIAFSDDQPDLILLDIMMPVMNGYEVCERLHNDARTRHIPIIFVTAMSEDEDEEKGLILGGVDYITKPISPPVVRARVRTQMMLLAQKRRLEGLVQQLESQTRELAQWNATLESRVATGISQLDRLSRLQRFFSPAVADLILSGGTDDPLKSRRREIVVVFLDIRGYTAFTETSDPEDVMQILSEYHAAMGRLIMEYGATLERFGGDSLMTFFNDPITIADPVGTAVRMAIAMQKQMESLSTSWARRGINLSMGIGIAQGYATIGAIGFEGRRDYGAIGTVTNIAARLCSEAKGGQILITERVSNQLPEYIKPSALGELTLKGLHRGIATYSVSI